VEVVLDWRSSETDEQMRLTLRELLDGLPAAGELSAPWTPQNTPGFATTPDHPLARRVLPYTAQTTPDVWRFATDGRYTFAAGWPTVGWGPGDENLAHTTRESIGVEELTGYAGRLVRLLSSETP
jgi:acetylornithine deacetylase/succinyl-diaminopimelate desuccinylase-like protein